MVYEHKLGQGRVFPQTKSKHEKAPHFNGTCNPEGTQKSISLWIELIEGTDPVIIDKIKTYVKQIGIKIEEPYIKDNQGGSNDSKSKDQW